MYLLMKAKSSDDILGHTDSVDGLISFKVLPVPAVLFERPRVHLCGADAAEEPARQRVGGRGKAEPAGDFPEIIGARHAAEQLSLWDAPLRGALGPQPLEPQVRVEVHELADGPRRAQRQQPRRPALQRQRVQRVVPKVGNGDAAEQPVVRRILRQIPNGHRGGAEAVHPQRLRLALHIVQYRRPKRQLLLMYISDKIRSSLNGGFCARELRKSPNISRACWMRLEEGYNSCLKTIRTFPQPSCTETSI